MEGSPIFQLMCATMQAVEDVCGEPETISTPRVNVVFYVPGSLLAFEDLKKIEAARFTRKEKLLLVAVPVSREVAKLGASVAFIVDALRQAVAIAADVFARKKVAGFDLADAEVIVDKVRIAMEKRMIGKNGQTH